MKREIVNAATSCEQWKYARIFETIPTGADEANPLEIMRVSYLPVFGSSSRVEGKKAGDVGHEPTFRPPPILYDIREARLCQE